MPHPEDEELREDFAATSESVEDDAQQLVDIEHEKQGLDPADPRVDALSIEAELLAGRIRQESRIERQIADEIETQESRDRTN
jgi:hypothetical protein